jgi:hypothetical protein
MGIDHTERRFLEAQGFQNPGQYQVFENIGDVAGVEMVAIVHRMRIIKQLFLCRLAFLSTAIFPCAVKVHCANNGAWIGAMDFVQACRQEQERNKERQRLERDGAAGY